MNDFDSIDAFTEQLTSDAMDASSVDTSPPAVETAIEDVPPSSPPAVEQASVESSPSSTEDSAPPPGMPAPVSAASTPPQFTPAQYQQLQRDHQQSQQQLQQLRLNEAKMTGYVQASQAYQQQQRAAAEAAKAPQDPAEKYFSGWQAPKRTAEMTEDEWVQKALTSVTAHASGHLEGQIKDLSERFQQSQQSQQQVQAWYQQQQQQQAQAKFDGIMTGELSSAGFGEKHPASANAQEWVRTKAVNAHSMGQTKGWGETQWKQALGVWSKQAAGFWPAPPNPASAPGLSVVGGSAPPVGAGGSSSSPQTVGSNPSSPQTMADFHDQLSSEVDRKFNRR